MPRRVTRMQKNVKQVAEQLEADVQLEKVRRPIGLEDMTEEMDVCRAQGAISGEEIIGLKVGLILGTFGCTSVDGAKRMDPLVKTINVT